MFLHKTSKIGEDPTYFIG